jgi:serine protease
MFRKPGLLVCLVLASVSAFAGNIIHVPANQPTIQAAINAAVNGDTVLVSPGTYVKNIDFKGKAITVKSSNGAKVTIVDGGNIGPVVTFASQEQ